MSTVKMIALYIVGIGPEGTPNGHLFAHVMADGVELNEHMGMIEALKKMGFVEEKSFYLTLTIKGLELHGKIAAVLAEEVK